MAWRSELCRRITHTARQSLLRSVDLWAVRYARACTDARSRPLQKAPLPAHSTNCRCQLRRRNLPRAQPSLALHLTSHHKREKQRHAKREYPCRLAKRVVPPHTRIARHHKSRRNPYKYEYTHPQPPLACAVAERSVAGFQKTTYSALHRYSRRSRRAQAGVSLRLCARCLRYVSSQNTQLGISTCPQIFYKRTRPASL